MTLTGSGTVQVNVKSGRIMDLALELPEGVSLLNLTAPSLRTYKIVDDGTPQLVNIEFTQEMEGQFRLDLTYERILSEGESQVEVPTLAVQGAEVEQGRIAVEALSAVEVQAALAEQLTSLDISELPQQLILRTTNPILLAYKYVHSQPRHRLKLEVTRHKVLGVQEAAIDHADYHTLFTTDGLLVTTAEFTVRNSRKQFLRVRLPGQSQVWSSFVDGRPEKPAQADGQQDSADDEVLIKIINSTRPFSVHLIYATKGDSIGRLGVLEGTLPKPDILVTESRWDVFVPEDMHYGEPATNMELVQPGSTVSKEDLDAALDRLQEVTGAPQAIEPLRIMVPTTGIRYVFDKLYANQAGGEAWFQLPYASPLGAWLGHGMSLVGVLLLWAGMWLYQGAQARQDRLVAAGLGTLGGVFLLVSIGIYQQSPALPLLVSVVLGLALALFHARRLVSPWREVGT